MVVWIQRFKHWSDIMAIIIRTGFYKAASLSLQMYYKCVFSIAFANSGAHTLCSKSLRSDPQKLRNGVRMTMAAIVRFPSCNLLVTLDLFWTVTLREIPRSSLFFECDASPQSQIKAKNLADETRHTKKLLQTVRKFSWLSDGNHVVNLDLKSGSPIDLTFTGWVIDWSVQCHDQGYIRT